MKTIEYEVEGREFSVNISDLCLEYKEICSMSNIDFMNKLPKVAHFCCIVFYIERGKDREFVSDKGLLHEIIHLMHIPEEPMINLMEVREKFQLDMFKILSSIS